MSLSVVIPSKTARNLIPCMDAVLRNEPEAEIVVVDDGLEFIGADLTALGRFDTGGRAWRVHGRKPFCFSINVNIGIRAAGDNDVVVLGDDGILQVPLGFSILQRAAHEHPEFGVIASSCNNVGNPNQHPRGIGLREDPRMVCFVAVLIPRRTIGLVGLLDEDYTAYGFEDDDYCYRARRAGLKIGIHDGCFVDHASLESTFRGRPAAGGDLSKGREIFEHKWGAYPL